VLVPYRLNTNLGYGQQTTIRTQKVEEVEYLNLGGQSVFLTLEVST